PEAKRYMSLMRDITSPGIFSDPGDLKIFFFAHFPGRLRDSTLRDIVFSETWPFPKITSISYLSRGKI
ncbi:MAG: hypothetical protein V1789_06450, partial [PVC group bacterium]